MTDLPRYFVLDVESFGLYGEDFAVAYTVVDRSGTELDAGLFNCSVELAGTAHASAEFAQPVIGFVEAPELGDAWAQRSAEDWVWISQNVLPHMPQESHTSRQQVHSDFWDAWLRWQQRGATMWADYGYPVEAGFLRACVFENPARIDTAPCPLHEIETVRVLTGVDLARKLEHLPAHDPLNDCRHSARVLIESLNRLGL